MSTQLFKDPNILNLLEWPLIVQEVKKFCHFEKTADNRIFTLKDNDQIENIYNNTELFISYIYDDFLKDTAADISKLNKNEQIIEIIQKVEKDAIVELTDINQAAILIEVYLQNYTSFSSLQLITESKDVFHKQKRKYTQNFLKEFRSFVDEDGNIDFFKHPLLRKLYKDIVELENNIRKKLSSLKNNDHANILQFEGHDIINDRFVVAVKTDNYRTTLGQIISRSDSGQTLYVEPISVKDQNYKRLELVIDLKKEVANLATKFSRFIKENAEHLKVNLAAIFEFDHLYTLALYSNNKDLCRPKLSNDIHIELKNMFHPLIDKPVKNDVYIQLNDNGIIISGPNTGGKTATLKTIILIILLARNGVYVPADHAVIHLYENLFYFGNDGQNLPDGLSSFAAEVQNYTELFNNLGKSNLVIIDEIFNSTSSEEASALAISLFTELIKIGGSHLVVSTHHQMLKTFIHQDSKFVSAHVGFDSDQNKPTYKLIYGLPGSSQALRIFSLLTEKNNVNKAIFENALKVLDKKMISYENLLESVSKKELELDKTLRENKEINQQLKNQKNAMEGVYKLKLDEKLKSAEQRIKKLFDKAEDVLARSKDKSISKKVMANIESDIKKDINSLNALKKEDDSNKYSHMQKPSDLKVGEEYFSVFLGQTVKLKTINRKKNEALVTKGIVTIKCPLDSLRLPGHKKHTSQQQVMISFDNSRSSKLEYDCRGMRLEEFQSVVEQAISDLLTAKVPFINIIHGHGTGVLKGWLRKYVKSHRDITTESNDTGNDGETRIILS